MAPFIIRRRQWLSVNKSAAVEHIDITNKSLVTILKNAKWKKKKKKTRPVSIASVRWL